MAESRLRARPTPSPIVRVLHRDVGSDNPFRAIDDKRFMHPSAARRSAKSIRHELPLAEAVGKPAAEEVEIYPR